MTKSAIKKYTERLGFFGMILHYIGRFMTKTEQQVIGKLTVRFGKVKKNRLVFKNREMMDCTDNPEAFYEYLIVPGIIKNMRSSGWSLKKENSEIRIPEM